MKPQTIKQILCSLTLGGYTARVVEGRLETEGPQPLAGPLPASIKARSWELVAFLNEFAEDHAERLFRIRVTEAKTFAERYVEGRLRVLGRIRLKLLQQILRDAGGEPSYALPAAQSLGCTVKRMPEYENREFVFAPREEDAS